MLRDRIGSAAGGDSKGFRDAFCGLARSQGREFEQRLGALASADDVEAAHQARIGVKRLRYLVEPLRAQLREARAVIKSLKHLQDRLGKLHDMHVLESEIAKAAEGVAAGKAGRLHARARERRRDVRPGLVALAARARTHRNELFNELGRSGLRKCRRELTAQIGELIAVTMRPPGAVEVERKYLLKALPPVARKMHAQEIEQGWLPGKRLRERLRRVRDADGERFYRTIKFGAGIQRLEIEEETTAELFGALWPLTEGCRVRKRRHQVREGALTWEIDGFQDRNLVLAEVELTEAGMEVEPPKWLRPYVVREVTVDPAFLNLNLAR
jgi:CYTH domain-containing protein